MLTASVIILLLTVLVAIDDATPRDLDDQTPLNGIPVKPVRVRSPSRLRLP